MPCDTISTVTVQFNQKTDRALLVAALTSLGKNPYVSGENVTFSEGTYVGRTGEIQWRANRYSPQDFNAKTAEIKRAYSAEVVKGQAKKYGWTLKETAPYQYEVMKR